MNIMETLYAPQSTSPVGLRNSISMLASLYRWHSFIAVCSDASGVLEWQHSSLSKISSRKKLALPARSHSLIKGSHSDRPDLPRPLSRTKGSECPLDVKKPFESVHIMRDDKKRNIDGNLCSGDHYERVQRPIEG